VQSAPPEIFDRAARRLRRDRAARDYARHAFLHDWMLEGIADRLDAVKRSFADVLDLGCADARFVLPGATIVRADPGAAFAAAAGGVQVDEDRLPFGPASFDLIVSAGTLDTVNDLPGALVQIRRALRPGGLFLGAFAGAGSVARLKAAFRAADPGAARVHPQVDVRAAGDLLHRTGFALPVADTEVLTARYADLFALVRDLRGMGATNVLAGRTPLTRAKLAAAAAAFADQADPDGRVAERFEVVFMTGWAPEARS
jgi:SAM-dependent methyltransferase